MNLTQQQLNILTIALINFHDKVCKTGRITPEIEELCKMLNNEYDKVFRKTL